MINKKTLQTYQKALKWRYRFFKTGRQQGLGMIWSNMMADLKTGYEINKKKDKKLA